MVRISPTRACEACVQFTTTPAKPRAIFLRKILYPLSIGTKRGGATQGWDLDAIPAWMNDLAALDNPIRREFHLFLLPSGSRPDALKRAQISDIDFKARVLRIPKPKGGEAKAFDIPLSRAIDSFVSYELCALGGCSTQRKREIGFSQPTAPAGTSPNTRKINKSWQSGEMTCGRLTVQSRKPPLGSCEIRQSIEFASRGTRRNA